MKKLVSAAIAVIMALSIPMAALADVQITNTFYDEDGMVYQFGKFDPSVDKEVGLFINLWDDKTNDYVPDSSNGDISKKVKYSLNKEDTVKGGNAYENAVKVGGLFGIGLIDDKDITKGKYEANAYSVNSEGKEIIGNKAFVDNKMLKERVTNILVDGKSLDFDVDKLEYRLYEENVPIVTATGFKCVPEVTQAEAVPGFATVTAGGKIYKIFFDKVGIEEIAPEASFIEGRCFITDENGISSPTKTQGYDFTYDFGANYFGDLGLNDYYAIAKIDISKIKNINGRFIMELDAGSKSDNMGLLYVSAYELPETHGLDTPVTDFTNKITKTPVTEPFTVGQTSRCPRIKLDLTDYAKKRVAEGSATLTVALKGETKDQFTFHERCFLNFNAPWGEYRNPKIYIENSAALQEIKVNDIALTEFNKNLYEYTVEVPEGTTPVVSATAENPETEIRITQADSLPGTATIITLNGDKNTALYTFNFKAERDYPEVEMPYIKGLNINSGFDLVEKEYAYMGASKYIMQFDISQLEGITKGKKVYLNFRGSTDVSPTEISVYDVASENVVSTTEGRNLLGKLSITSSDKYENPARGKIDITNYLREKIANNDKTVTILFKKTGDANAILYTGSQPAINNKKNAYLFYEDEREFPEVTMPYVASADIASDKNKTDAENCYMVGNTTKLALQFDIRSLKGISKNKKVFLNVTGSSKDINTTTTLYVYKAQSEIPLSPAANIVLGNELGNFEVLGSNNIYNPKHGEIDVTEYLREKAKNKDATVTFIVKMKPNSGYAYTGSEKAKAHKNSNAFLFYK